ncbi:DUF6268 family outer membrane beta-barrel protein [Flavobacterium hibisci]|uniref:DUF6268 family outer membrane beta-barrel protein n=1 Tax=Flavobacterium hibisci TaxID=1914462 RepID=UPI001CBD8C06|nr:DUF6268 family outer membrane beta-barrel protein [Flavobacterium hibisci]MBZ4041817.1 DUF6268 family outer membrane beta-barrel protein [Flavobacterium hibisci]
MKKKDLVLVLFWISFLNMKAQEKLVADFNLKTEPTEKINFNEINTGIAVYKKIDDKNEITNKLEYTNLKIKYDTRAYYDFENLNQFNQIQNKLEISRKISELTRLNFSVKPTINFQQNLDISDVTLLGSFQLKQQLTSKIGLNIGVERSTIFGNPKFIPTLSFYGKINQTNILIGFPDSAISYSNNERNKFSVSNNFNGNFYNLDKSLESYSKGTKISTSQITTAFEYERNMDKNWFVNFKAGYDFNKQYDLVDENNHKLYDFNTGNGYILSIGIKYKQ